MGATAKQKVTRYWTKVLEHGAEKMLAGKRPFTATQRKHAETWAWYESNGGFPMNQDLYDSVSLFAAAVGAGSVSLAAAAYGFIVRFADEECRSVAE